MKTKEMTGKVLDYFVGMCEGEDFSDVESFVLMWEGGIYRYSTDWAEAGPIIERERIDLLCDVPASEYWVAHIHEDFDLLLRSDGLTPMIAAMRGFVRSKVGEELKVPKELT